MRRTKEETGLADFQRREGREGGGETEEEVEEE